MRKMVNSALVMAPELGNEESQELMNSSIRFPVSDVVDENNKAAKRQKVNSDTSVAIQFLLDCSVHRGIFF